MLKKTMNEENKISNTFLRQFESTPGNFIIGAVV